jgi:hypothetical protein
LLKKTLFLVAVIIVLVVLVFGLPGKYEEVAKCLAEQGAVMYGSNLCPNCQEQKALFGFAFRHVNYVNCDLRSDECVKQGIYALPTWIIDGEQIVATRSPEELASIAGCSNGG